MIFLINGFRESKGYFMSFGFTQDEFERMLDGEVISRDGNKFSIENLEDE